MQPELFLIGDSHAGAIKRAAERLGITFVGGTLSAGRALNDYFFTVDAGVFVPTGESERVILSRWLKRGNFGNNLLQVRVPILSTIGSNAHHFESQLRTRGYCVGTESNGQFLSRAVVKACVSDARRGALEFYRVLKEAGCNVYAVPPPRRFTPAQAPLRLAFEEEMIRNIAALGVGIIDVRHGTTNGDGSLRPEYFSQRPGDKIHANEDYAALVLERFRREIGAPSAASVTALADAGA